MSSSKKHLKKNPYKLTPLVIIYSLHKESPTKDLQIELRK
jgi:hypothetical protein